MFFEDKKTFGPNASRHSAHLRIISDILTTIKGKVAPVNTIKAHGGVDSQLHSFFIPALYGGEWSATEPDALRKDFPVRMEKEVG